MLENIFSYLLQKSLLCPLLPINCNSTRNSISIFYMYIVSWHNGYIGVFIDEDNDCLTLFYLIFLYNSKIVNIYNLWKLMLMICEHRYKPRWCVLWYKLEGVRQALPCVFHINKLMTYNCGNKVIYLFCFGGGSTN